MDIWSNPACRPPHGFRRWRLLCDALAVTLIAMLACAAAGCRRPRDGKSYYGSNEYRPPAAVPVDTVVVDSERPPGLNLLLDDVSGASGDTGNFRPGDRVTVTFRITLDDGYELPISELDSLEAHISGPTFNYQRVIGEIEVIPSIGEVPDEIEYNEDGSYTWSFPPLPEEYIDPPNYTGANPDGVLSGSPLLDGTYTLVLAAYKNYTWGTKAYKDLANATRDFLLGDALLLESREVVTDANCGRCHDELEAHTRGLPGGGSRKEVRTCVTCHVAGAEDWNDPLVAGGTPGVSVEFKVMIHRIHNGAHLPSVVGVATNPGGSRSYLVGPQPYVVVSSELEILDFSAASFPWMPSGYFAYLYAADGATYTGTGGNGPMPRDTGYSALPLGSKLMEDKVRTGLVACTACHGDPDGAGPLDPPAQGTLAETQATRRACGSCHDDVDWSLDYASNGASMGPQPDDSGCASCHVGTSNSLDTVNAHTHPYTNSALNPGVHIDVTGVSPGSGPLGNYMPGDAVSVTFGVTDEAGADVLLRTLTRLQMIVSGPTSNTQVVIPGIAPYDTNWRKSSPFTGTGTISTPSIDPLAVQQVLCVNFTGANTFSVEGSVGGVYAAGLAVPDPGSIGPLTYGGVTFTITDGGTNFVAGDRWYFEVIPVASSYTMRVPMDFALERLGIAGTGPFTAANLPLYWGRQTVFERTAVSAGTVTGPAVTQLQQRYVVLDASTLATSGIGGGSIAVGDRVVLDSGLATEEYLTIGRIQTSDDTTFLDLGTSDRMWFTTPMRYTHAAGAPLLECTLTAMREGPHYTVTGSPLGTITEVGGFTAGRTIVISYRTDGRFGWRRTAADSLQSYYPAPNFDSDDFDQTAGEWKNMPFVSGTYSVGLWANRDYTVDPSGAVVATEAWNLLASDNTTYRAISPPAIEQFLFGSAIAVEPRRVISSGENCNSCHGELMFHGNGRSGLDTCLLCHTAPGTEDAAKYSYNSWYVTATPRTTVDFRELIHKVHRGHELALGSSYRVNGVFLGVPYPFSAEDIVFPPMRGGTQACTKCHGDPPEPGGAGTWEVPANRNHPTAQTVPVREWRSACGSCHDSGDSAAHIDLNTSPSGEESCGACHGIGATYSVGIVHRNR